MNYKWTGGECHLLFSKQAMIVTKVDQRLVIESKAAETVSHCKALKTRTGERHFDQETLEVVLTVNS